MPALTPARAKEIYRTYLRYSVAMEMAAAFGVSERSFRAMTEGAEPSLKKIVFPGTTRGYYDRDTLLGLITRQD